MKKVLFLTHLLFFSTLLFSYVDDDFDGVDDAEDRCPNTPFSDLVDRDGCTICSLVSQHNFDIVVGMSYSESDYQTLNTTDTLSTMLQVDYYYKNFSLQASTSYFTTEGDAYNERGLNDSYITLSYQLAMIQKVLVRFDAGLIIPTYSSTLNNNETDYLTSINFSYNVEDINFFGGVSYTFINDTDITLSDDANISEELNYENTLALSLGLGYYFDDALYVSGAYNRSDSIYKSVQDIETLSLYGYYEIDEAYFSTLSYAYGLSESASKNYLSLRFGYLF